MKTKLRTRIFSGFIAMSIIGLIMGIIGFASINLITQMSDELGELHFDAETIVDILGRHNEWKHRLIESVLTGLDFDGEQNPTMCALGLWLDSGKLDSIDDPVLRSLFDDIVAPHNILHSRATEILQMRLENEEDAIELFVRDILPQTNGVTTGLMAVEGRYIELINLKTDEIKDNGRRLGILIIMFVFIPVVLGLLLAALITPSILKPITALSSYVKNAAAGDFSKRLPHKYEDEMGQLFEGCNALVNYSEESVKTLKKTVKKVRESSQDMLAISSKMASNSKGLNKQTSSASTSAEEFSAGMTQSSNSLSTASIHISAVASSIEEINSTIATLAAAAEQTSMRVDQSSSLVDSIKESISKASGTVDHVSNAFNSVAESVVEINKSIAVISKQCVVTVDKMSDAEEKATNTNMTIQRLEAASKQIGKIVNVINDIADQTNMLALNAAIEAAGAGEAGKGFMVVANEVKELARQTAKATDEIATQIENMQMYMPDAVDAVTEITAIINTMSGFMNSLSEEILQQGNRSDQIAEDSSYAAKRMSEINTEINRISENAVSVTNTVIDSTKGVNEIAQSIAELVVGTQEIAMNSERASNNISEIDHSAKEMAIGLVEISRAIHLIDAEASAIQQSADSTKESSEELLSIADDLGTFSERFKIGQETYI